MMIDNSLILEKNSLPSNKKFGYFFGITFFCFFLYLFHLNNSFSFLFLLLSGLILSITYKHSHLLSPLNRIWMMFGILLGKIISPIILALIYFMLFTPIGFLRRSFGNDILKLKSNKLNTYWVNIDKVNSSNKSFFDQF